MWNRFHFLYAVAWALVGLGVILLCTTFWISTWSRDSMGLFVNDILPGYGFLPRIVPRLGLVGAVTLGLGVLAIYVSAAVTSRPTK